MSCRLHWPENQSIEPGKAIIYYSFVLGFALPVPIMCFFYLSIVLRLRNSGPVEKSKERRKSHRRVTRLVLTVVAVFIVCWLPFWIFQVHIVSNNIREVSTIIKIVFNGFTLMTVSNSMLNPFLYAFISDNFRKSFAQAFQCLSHVDLEMTMCQDNKSMHKTHSKHKGMNEEELELAAMEARTKSILRANSRSELTEQSYIEENSSIKPMIDQEGHLKLPQMSAI